MALKAGLEMEQLRRDLTDAGYTVVAVGKRWRVTNPAGGEPVFMPNVLPKGGKATTLATLLRDLQRVGYDPQQAEQAREQARQQRLAADRRAGDAALAQAEREAAERATPTPAIMRQRKPVASTPAPDLHTLRTEVVDLTADAAAELLRLNSFYDPAGRLDVAAGEARTNRPFKPELARKYRDAMLRGEWRLTHQGIAVDRNGVMVDGQHRAVAVVEAAEVRPGITVPTMITWGLEPEAFDAVDIGRKRTVGDVLASHGVKASAQVAAVARLVLFYDAKLPPGDWRHVQMSPEQTLAKLHAEPELHEAARWGAYKALALPAAEGAARHVIMRACDGPAQPAALAFFEAYRSGAGLDVVGNPVLTLRNLMMAQARDRKRKRDGLEQFALIIKAWNAHVAGRQQKTLAWRVTEDVPRVVLLG